jgi:hypothetical protein
MQIFGQVWLWSLGSFLLGAFFTWLLLVRPMRKRLIELEDEPGPARPEPVPTRIAEPAGPGLMPPAPPQPQGPNAGQGSGPGPNAADKFLDDLFETQTKAVPPFPSTTPAPMAPPAPVALPTRPAPVQPSPEPIQSRPAPQPVAPADDDTELSDNPFQRFTESTTVFVPPSNLPVPPEVSPSGEDWFAKENEDPQAITDVEDDEVVDDGGTIFTQHTTPIPAEVIRALDESQPPAAPEHAPAELTQTMPPPARHGYDDHDDEDFQPAEEHLQELSGYEEPAYQPAPEAVEAFVAHEYEPEPLPVRTYQGRREVTPETEMGRSLFEPVVPVAADQGETDEDDEFVPPGPFGPGSAMPLPGGGSPAPEFNVKASVTALRYCTQDNPQFDRIVAEVWFRTPSDAERVGFRVLS